MLLKNIGATEVTIRLTKLSITLRIARHLIWSRSLHQGLRRKAVKVILISISFLTLWRTGTAQELAALPNLSEFTRPPLTIKNHSEGVEVSYRLHLEPGLELNKNVRSYLKVENDSLITSQIESAQTTLRVPIKQIEKKSEVSLIASVFFCSSSPPKMCYVKSFRWKQPVAFAKQAKDPTSQGWDELRITSHITRDVN